MTRIRRCLLLLGLMLPAAMLARAGDLACQRMEESKQEVTDFLIQRAEEIKARAEAEVRSSASWERVRSRREEELRDMLGLLPWPQRTPLNVRITGTLDRGQYVIEKIVFESMPKVYVTANLYLPKQRRGRLPAIVYVCGHALSKYGAKTQYQAHGITFAKNGYIALIVDPIQCAETFALHAGVLSLGMNDWYSRGYTPGGVEAWNAIRAIDYLVSRPEVDAERIGITGRSGGAAVSFYTAALDQRVKAACPVMGISTYAADLRENTLPLHCDCMFPVNFYMQDMMHQTALIAPRPLLMAHGHKDNLFPVPGYTKVEQVIGELYASYGKREHFHNLVVETGHADSDYLREQAVRWFDRYLMKMPDRKLDMSYEKAAPEQLAVFPDGPPADARDADLPEFFTTPQPAGVYRTRKAWEDRRTVLLQSLRAKVFANVPAIPEKVSIDPDQPDKTQSSFQTVRISAPGFVGARALLRKPKVGGKVPALLFVASGEDTPSSCSRFFLNLNRRNDVLTLILFPAGTGEIPWDSDFARGALRNAMVTGQTIDSIRLAQVRMALAALRQMEVDPARIMIGGRGESGAIGLYAAIFEPSVEQVMLIDPPASHYTGPTFLNILRFTDLPEAAALLAPRHLNFYSRVPAAYEYTRQVYRLYGKPGNVSRTFDVGAVLNGRYDLNFGSGGE